MSLEPSRWTGARCRAVVGAAVCLLIGFAAGSASAQTGACSRTNLRPGQSITVSGNGADPGETVNLLFDGSVIGGATVDGFGNYSVSGSVPATTAPGTYAITVDFATSTDFSPCNVVVQDDPVDDDPDDDDDDADDDDDDDSDSDDDDDDDSDDDDSDDGGQQQEQGPGGGQQQRGSGGGQQQQQQVVLPATLAGPPSGRSLPRTGVGVDLAEVLGVSTGSLLVGFSLMDLARRRRRRPVTAPPDRPPMSEADLLWPRWS